MEHARCRGQGGEVNDSALARRFKATEGDESVLAANRDLLNRRSCRRRSVKHWYAGWTHPVRLLCVLTRCSTQVASCCRRLANLVRPGAPEWVASWQCADADAQALEQASDLFKYPRGRHLPVCAGL